MIRLEYKNVSMAKEAHFGAILAYVKSKKEDWIDNLYVKIRKLVPTLPLSRDNSDFAWLQDFILVSPQEMETWVISSSQNLKFDEFKKIYLNRFAKGPQHFVDPSATYNAFSLLELIDFNVCPYCEDEFFDIIEIEGKKKRTCDFDHFHAKNLNKFPALAMCFYNLVPSGKCCNFIKNEDDVTANPYEHDIELLSKFYEDTPPMMNIESMRNVDIRVKLDVKGKMIKNNEKLGIEARYNHRTQELKRLFRLKRSLNPQNISQMESLGIDIKELIGNPYPQEKGNSLHQKLRFDILGL